MYAPFADITIQFTKFNVCEYSSQIAHMNQCQRTYESMQSTNSISTGTYREPTNIERARNKRLFNAHTRDSRQSNYDTMCTKSSPSSTHGVQPGDQPFQVSCYKLAFATNVHTVIPSSQRFNELFKQPTSFNAQITLHSTCTISVFMCS